LDKVNECLWHHRDNGEDERVRLTPKAFAVLQYLVEHPGRLLTQNELLEAAWPDTFVQPEVLKSQILDIRRVLGDDSKNPRFIETLPRRGYQFIAPVTQGSSSTSPSNELASLRVVGRTTQLDQLRACLRKSLEHERQVVFITGETGIGKTTLADEFMRRVAIDFSDIRIARGQCVEGFGSKEEYYPILEALSQLCNGSGADKVVQTLLAHAPTWLVQFPALVRREQRDTLQQEIVGATRERMLREIGDALETISLEKPLLLILEDLHWSDRSTVDFISSLARRRSSGKLMFIGTYRPVDTVKVGCEGGVD
jgi:DNA-binding winged helix-turn-helix (wHTH) protein